MYFLISGDLFIALIFLGCQLLSILTTVYILTILLNITGHIKNYFKLFYFESAIALNITVILVLVSIYIAVVDGLPVTSYIKMIESWMLFNLVIPLNVGPSGAVQTVSDRRRPLF